MRSYTGLSRIRLVLILWGPVILYAGLIFVLSSRSHPEEDLPSWYMAASDKLWHGLEYAGLGALCYRAFRGALPSSHATQAVVWAIVAASLYGVTDEIHQAFVPFREAAWQDWLADIAGGALGALIASRLPLFLLLLPFLAG